jgi:hypothetical protein
MTRETKLGLAVGTSFVSLVAVVLLNSWRNGDEPKKPDEPEEHLVAENKAPSDVSRERTHESTPNVLPVQFQAKAGDPPYESKQPSTVNPAAPPTLVQEQVVPPPSQPPAPRESHPVVPALPAAPPTMMAAPGGVVLPPPPESGSAPGVVGTHTPGPAKQVTTINPGEPLVPPAPTPPGIPSIPPMPSSQGVPPVPSGPATPVISQPPSGPTIPGIPPAPSGAAIPGIPPAPSGAAISGVPSQLPGVPPGPAESGGPAKSVIAHEIKSQADVRQPEVQQPSALPVFGPKNESKPGAADAVPGAVMVPLPPSPGVVSVPNANPLMQSQAPLIAAAPATPSVAVPPAPAHTAPAQVESYAAKRYISQADDVDFATVSKKEFNNPNYAQALIQYNRDILGPNAVPPGPSLPKDTLLYIPSADVLQKKYPQLLRPVEAPAALPTIPETNAAPPVKPLTPVPPPIDVPVVSGPIGQPPPVAVNNGGAAIPITPAPTAVPSPNSAGTPVGSWPAANSTPVANTKLYWVPQGGKYLYQIAQETLGDGRRWMEIWQLNNSIVPEAPITAGTQLRMPPDAHVGP